MFKFYCGSALLKKKALLVLLAVFLVGSSQAVTSPLTLNSPDNKHRIVAALESDGVLHAQFFHNDKVIIKDITFGNVFLEGGALKSGLKILDVVSSSEDMSYGVAIGKRKNIQDHYNQMVVHLAETTA